MCVVLCGYPSARSVQTGRATQQKLVHTEVPPQVLNFAELIGTTPGDHSISKFRFSLVSRASEIIICLINLVQAAVQVSIQAPGSHGEAH